jgi:hypothetical protein
MLLVKSLMRISIQRLFKKMRVKLAVELLSHSMSTAIRTSGEIGQLYRDTIIVGPWTPLPPGLFSAETFLRTSDLPFFPCHRPCVFVVAA